MAVFIDSATLIASMCKQEKHFAKAAKIVPLLEKGHVRMCYTDYILDEVLTFIRNRYGVQASLETLDVLMSSKIEMIKVEHKHIAAGLEIFKKYPKLSFTDAISVAVMFEKDIPNICSFDSDFDSVPRIKRLEEFE